MSGPWVLAIDFGTSFTSAAMVADGRMEVLEVDGLRRLPSTVLWAHDELVVGTAAESQRVLNPRAADRNPKRALGLRRNLLLDGHAVPVEQAVAAVLGAVYQEALRRSGQVPPAEVRLTHPARWSEERLAALRAAASAAGIPSVSLMAEPVAAAVHYGGGHVATGEYVAVYDLGGGTFDTTVLRRTDDGFELAGPPGGDDRLGGEDFDHRLMDFVLARLAVTDPDAASALRESNDLHWRRAAADLLLECRQAKEALSRQTAYTMLLPAPVSQEVRLTRPEFEALIRADIQRSIDEFSATIDAAGLEPSDISARYLTGGSSRIPLVSRLLHEAFDAVPDTFDDPKVAVALGAAQAPHIDGLQQRRAESPTVPLAIAAAALAPPVADAPPPVAPPAVPPPPWVEPPSPPGPSSRPARKGWRMPVMVGLAAAAAVALLLGAVAAVVVTRDGGANRPAPEDALPSQDASVGSSLLATPTTMVPVACKPSRETTSPPGPASPGGNLPPVVVDVTCDIGACREPVTFNPLDYGTTDPDGGQIGIVAYDDSEPAVGTLSVTGDAFTYTAERCNCDELATVEFTVTDSQGAEGDGLLFLWEGCPT